MQVLEKDMIELNKQFATKEEAIRYCFGCVKIILNDVSKRDIQLLSPSVLENFIPNGAKGNRDLRYELLQKANMLKRCMTQDLKEQQRIGYMQMVDFIQDEIMHHQHPRPILVKTVLASMSQEQYFLGLDMFKSYKELVQIWLENEI